MSDGDNEQSAADKLSLRVFLFNWRRQRRVKDEMNCDESGGSVRAGEGQCCVESCNKHALARCARVSRETAEVFGAWWCTDVADAANLSRLYAAQSKDSSYEGFWLLKKNNSEARAMKTCFSCRD